MSTPLSTMRKLQTRNTDKSERPKIWGTCLWVARVSKRQEQDRYHRPRAEQEDEWIRGMNGVWLRVRRGISPISMPAPLPAPRIFLPSLQYTILSLLALPSSCSPILFIPSSSPSAQTAVDR